MLKLKIYFINFVECNIRDRLKIQSFNNINFFPELCIKIVTKENVINN